MHPMRWVHRNYHTLIIDYFTLSLRTFTALNTGTLQAGILMVVSGFWGFLPSLSALSRTSKHPKPTIWTFSPFLRESVMMSRVASTTSAASFFCDTALFSNGSNQTILVHNKNLLWYIKNFLFQKIPLWLIFYTKSPHFSRLFLFFLHKLLDFVHCDQF